MASLSAVTAQLEAPASALVGAARWLLDGPLAAPLDAAEEAWRAVLPEQPVKVLDQFLAENGSAHAKSLPLMNPYDVATIITGYLAVVALGLLIKPPKIEPKLFVAAHNLFLAVLSLYMMTEILHQAYLGGYTLWGNPHDDSPKGWPGFAIHVPFAPCFQMAQIIWVFFASKIVEFNDTFIMILKQNYRQVSFLHVYHHVTIFAIWWLVTFTAPGGEAYYSAALNSFIHVVMYSYYLLSSLGVKQVSFIKHYITFMQMTQFFTMLMQSAYDNYTGGGGYPKLTTQILGVYMLTLLALFANFLRQDRKRLQQERKAQTDKGQGRSKKTQ